MADQGFGIGRSISENLQRNVPRPVPIGPAVLGAASMAVATVPAQEIGRVMRLAVCNPTAAAVSLTVTVLPPGGSELAQISAMEIEANTSVDLTDLIGGLYVSGTAIAALGEDLVLSGWMEALR